MAADCVRQGPSYGDSLYEGHLESNAHSSI